MYPEAIAQTMGAKREHNMSRLVEYGAYTGQDYINAMEWLHKVVEDASLIAFHEDAQKIMKEMDDTFEDDLSGGEIAEEDFYCGDGCDMFGVDDLFYKIKRTLESEGKPFALEASYPDAEMNFSLLEAE